MKPIKVVQHLRDHEILKVKGTQVLDTRYVQKTGDVMTGLLQYSGTDHAGICLNNLTTAQRDALTPAPGMLIYNTTDEQFQGYTTAWGQLGGGAGNPGGLNTHVQFNDGGNFGGDAGFVYDKTTGNVGIGATNPRTRLELGNDGAVLAVGTFGSGWTEPDLGQGTRLLWYPRKAAFRAGYVDWTQWNDTNIESYSTAMGYNTIASGIASTAMGENTTASEHASTAMGGNTTASGGYSTAMGFGTTASGLASTAMGEAIVASGNHSTAAGLDTTASGIVSTAIGQYVTAGPASNTIVLGQGVDDANRLANNTASSFMVGFNSDIPTLFVGPSAGAGTTGDVGVGTASPGYKLDVAGTVNMAGFRMPTGAQAGYVLTSNAEGIGTWQAGGGGGAGGWTDDGDVVRLTTSTDSVGIGTTEPAGKLHVASDPGTSVDVRLTGPEEVDQTATIYFMDTNNWVRAIWDGSTEIASYHGVTARSGTDNNNQEDHAFRVLNYNTQLFTIRSNGWVGIRTGPDEELHIVGDGEDARVLIENNDPMFSAIAAFRAVSTPYNSIGQFETGEEGTKIITNSFLSFVNSTGTIAEMSPDSTDIHFYGKVGVGTAAPGQRLSVVQNVNHDPPGLGNSGGIFGIFKDDGFAGGNYGLMSGVQSTGNVWMQVQRRDGTATAYDLLLQPSGGNVGVGTTSPNVSCDVNGGLALRVGAMTLGNGQNHNIAIGNRSFIRVTGPTAAFTLTGFANGYNGKLLVVYNATTQNMTIANENANSSAANRIRTLTGSNVSLTGTSSATFIYSSTDNRWIFIGERV